MGQKSQSRISRLSKIIVCLLLASPCCLDAYGRKEDPAIAHLQNSISTMQHQLSNGKSEIKAFEERLLNFEVMLDAVREEIAESKNQHKEMVQTRNQSLELRIANLEQTEKSLSLELKQLIKETKQKLSELDNAIALQNKNFGNLQNAVASLIEAFQDKPEGANTYTVKNGDSLAKIAKAHHTSVRAIKEHNGMTSDRIVVGKTLKIPSKS